MGAFNVKKPGKDIQEARDSVGSGGALDSGLYAGIIKNAYTTESSGGAQAMALEVELPEVNRTIRQTLYITNKEGEIFYEKDGKKHYLAGYLLADSLTMLASGGNVGVLELESEERHIQVYDSTEKKEVTKPADVLVDLLNVPILVGVIKIIKPKTEKQGDTWVEVDGEITINEIDKFFDPDTQMTVIELQDGSSDALFIEKWKNRWVGKERTIARKAAAPKGGSRSNIRKGAATPAAGATKPKKSFFNK